MRPSSPRTGSSASSYFWVPSSIGSSEKGRREKGEVRPGAAQADGAPQRTSPFSHLPSTPASSPETLPNAEPQGALRSRLISQSGQVQQERVLKRDIPPAFVPSRRAAVPRFHVCPQDQPVGAGFHRPQLGGPLRRLDIQHLRIVQAGGNEQIRIHLLLYVVIP